MKVIIKDSYDEISNLTAHYIKNKIANYNPTPENKFVLGLPTGSSPLGTYKLLIKFYEEGLLSFKNVITFNMDEYVGVLKENNQSYHYFMYNNFFNHIDILKENINMLDGNAENLKQECRNYENKIKLVGGIDLFLCGLGKDGHIAFNEPGSSLSSITRLKTLCLETIQDNSRFFGNDESQVPTQALTVGIKTIMDAKEILLIVSGRKKSKALKMIIEKPISSMWTGSVLQNHNKAVIVCDEESTNELMVKTYKYFKNLQSISDISGLPYPNCIKQYINNEDTILITSPHPDDDIIGCGGLLQLLPNKENVKILYMTNGTGGLRGNEDRLKEALSALTILGYTIDNIEHENFPFYDKKDRKISNQDNEKMLEFLNRIRPNHIFVCGDHDPKGTHQKCYNILKTTNLSNYVKKIWIYKGAWETWQSDK